MAEQYIHTDFEGHTMFNGSRLIMPQEMTRVPLTHMYWYGKQANRLLKELGGAHTFQPTPDELVGYMLKNHASALINPLTHTLNGFVKMFPWVKPHPDSENQSISFSMSPFEAMKQNLGYPVAVEVGSLVVAPDQQRKHYAGGLVDVVCKQADIIYPQIPRIAVVTNDNYPSLKVFTRIGWQELDMQDLIELIGVDILYGWEPPSTVFVDRASL